MGRMSTETAEPGIKFDLEGKLVGWAQSSENHGQNGCLVHELHCESDTVIYKGDCSTWQVEKITIGNPVPREHWLGPVIDQKAVDAYRAAIDEVRQAGGTILYGGKVVERAGYFVEPTIVRAQNDWPVVQRETFAPILYVMPYRTMDDAIQMQNAVPQGLSSSLFTNQLRHRFP